MTQVVKRNGKFESFDWEKVWESVRKAALAAKVELTEDDVHKIVFDVPDPVSVEFLLDEIIERLYKEGYSDVADAFAFHRERRRKERDVYKKLMQSIADVSIKSAKDVDLKRENANIDGDSAMGQMLRFGSEAAKAFYLTRVINPEYADAHISGDIHIHDLDFYAMTTTCCQIDVGRLLEEGFDTGHGSIRPPKTIRTACNLACIIIQSNQNDQHGGQSIPNFDRMMAPFVDKTVCYYYQREMENYLRQVAEGSDSDVNEIIAEYRKGLEEKPLSKWVHYIENAPELNVYVKTASFDSDEDILAKLFRDYRLDDGEFTVACDLCPIPVEDARQRAYLRALELTRDETYQGMEALVHNLNTMHCLLGDQKVRVIDRGKERVMSIEEIYNDFEHGRYQVYSFNTNKKRIEKQPIIGCVDNGSHRPIVQTITESGRMIVSTPNHRFITYDKNVFDFVEVFAESAEHIMYRHDDPIIGYDRDTIISKLDSNSGERHVYDLSVYQNENFMLDNGAFVHNSRAGAQVPFSSINFGTDTSDAGRLVAKALLQAQENGLGHNETPIFPILIYRLKDKINTKFEDKNYDTFLQALRCSSKRMFPNFAFQDAPFNLQYYDETRPETEIAYMGAVTGDDVIVIEVDGEVLCMTFAEAYDKYHDRSDVKIWDSTRNMFVGIKKWMKYPDNGDWVDVTFSTGRYLRMTLDHPLPLRNEDKGRTECKDLQLGDLVPRSCYRNLYDKSLEFDRPNRVNPPFDPWLVGIICCDGSYMDSMRVSVGADETDIIDAIVERYPGRVEKTFVDRQPGGNYYDVRLHVCDQINRKKLLALFGSFRKAERSLPKDFLMWSRDDRMQLLAGIVDADGYVNPSHNLCLIGSTNKSLAIEQMILCESLGFKTAFYKNHHKGVNDKDNIRYRVEFYAPQDLPIVCEKKRRKLISGSIGTRKEGGGLAAVASINRLGPRDQFRYDVETESDKFDVSGLCSHNCRTRVIGNVHDKDREISYSRGNLSFTTINLPRLAYLARLANGNEPVIVESEPDWETKLKALLDVTVCPKLELVRDQLLERFGLQSARTVKNFPFLMKQGVWLDSETLQTNDKLAEVLKHGTLSIGFIGLAETLRMLCGAHHGESEFAQKVGLAIVKYMRDFCDSESAKRKLNFTLLATPSEGLCARFLRVDRRRFGVVPGYTDKEYITNSFHVPVEYAITAARKIEIEAPYHALTNAGHISYVELDGDAINNLHAFEKIVLYMKEKGMGYAAVNHPIDFDPECNYRGVIGETCPKCGRKETPDKPFTRIRRITGYLVGGLDRFNDGKKDEERRRVKHGLSN